MEIQDGLPLCTPHSLLGMRSLIYHFFPRDEKDQGLQITFCQLLRPYRNNCSCSILTAICLIEYDLYKRFLGLYSFLLKLILLKMMSKLLLTSVKTDLASILAWSSTAAPDTQ